MINRRTARTTLAAMLIGASLLGSPSALFAQASQPTALADLSTRVWADAKLGHADAMLASIKGVQVGDMGSDVSDLKSSATLLETNIAKREATRQEKLAEVDKKLVEQLAKTDADALSEALKLAVEMHWLRTDKSAFKAEPRIQQLITRSAEAARAAEAKGDWFIANEIYYRLHVLMEEEGTYKNDVRRLGQRLSMIRLYAPEEFWKLRNDERVKAGKSALPPYNGLGEDYQSKLKDVSVGMVAQAMLQSAAQQIDRKSLSDILAGGVEALRTFATTTSLQPEFPGIGDHAKRDAFVAFLDTWKTKLETKGFTANRTTLQDFIKQLEAANAASVKLPEKAVLHELGNGAMAQLDEFSAIIWPDELERFDRMTKSDFKGVGVQIQIDEASQMIKVVNPLEGTPAQRAGVKSGDLIKKIDGKSAVGISLNQAVDLITGPVDSHVVVTMERETDKTDADGKAVSQDIDFDLVRAVIPVAATKGWRRTGAHEDDWDWYIDRANKIGYIRLISFSERTSDDLKSAFEHMQQAGGVNGLILDLRYNPGGLLTQAVSVANMFIDRGVLVSTEGTMVGEAQEANPDAARFKGVPLAVLINEGSASASEIVSGAIRHYADTGQINAIVVGARSFGKGSVQNVWPLGRDARIKITTQYYKLPDGRILHRKPGAKTWGVEPHMAVEILPDTLADLIKFRQDADASPTAAADPKSPAPNPDKLINDGMDLQLQTALVLLKAKTVSESAKPKAQAAN